MAACITCFVPLIDLMSVQLHAGAVLSACVGAARRNAKQRRHANSHFVNCELVRLCDHKQKTHISVRFADRLEIQILHNIGPLSTCI